MSKVLVRTPLVTFIFIFVVCGCGGNSNREAAMQQTIDSLNDVARQARPISNDNLTVPTAPVPRPAPAPADTSSTLTGMSADPANSNSNDLFNLSEKTWDKLRNDEEKYSGQLVRFERLQVSLVNDDVLAHTKELHYVTITGEMGSYEFERGMQTPNYIPLHEDDWIDVSGIFQGVNSSGEVVIQLKKVKNLGIHP